MYRTNSTLTLWIYVISIFLNYLSTYGYISTYNWPTRAFCTTIIVLYTALHDNLSPTWHICVSRSWPSCRWQFRAESCANRIKDPVLSPIVINKLPAPEMHILVRVQFYRTLTYLWNNCHLGGSQLKHVLLFEHIINCSIIYIVAIENFTRDLRFQVVGDIL